MRTQKEFEVLENEFEIKYYETLIELLELKITQRINVEDNLKLLQEITLNLNKAKYPENMTLKVKSLSVREEEVFNLLLNGKGYKDIEKSLYIGPNTVKKHISNILQKLNCKTCTELILKYQKATSR